MLLLVIATPSHALNILERLIYKEARVGPEKILVNKVTGNVKKKLVNNRYEPISSQKGWGGIPSEKEMYQARYDRDR